MPNQAPEQIVLSLTNTTSGRYAVFFAPCDRSPLGHFGATVLRRKPTSADEWVNPEIAVNFDNTPVWRACIERPAHYGFHATIVAPFELHRDYTAEQLQDDLAAFCQTQQPLALTGLAPRLTHRYDALAFDDQPPEIKQFATRCVTRFEKYCAPLTEEDVQRRKKKVLTPAQKLNLQKHGYPYVFDDFNFHMTLSGTMPDDDNGFLRWLGVLYHQMVPDTPYIDRLCIFHQPDRKSAFNRIAELPFPG